MPQTRRHDDLIQPMLVAGLRPGNSSPRQRRVPCGPSQRCRAGPARRTRHGRFIRDALRATARSAIAQRAGRESLTGSVRAVRSLRRRSQTRCGATKAVAGWAGNALALSLAGGAASAASCRISRVDSVTSVQGRSRTQNTCKSLQSRVYYVVDETRRKRNGWTENGREPDQECAAGFQGLTLAEAGRWAGGPAVRAMLS